MAGHAQLKFVMTECSKIQICLTRHILCWYLILTILLEQAQLMKQCVSLQNQCMRLLAKLSSTTNSSDNGRSLSFIAYLVGGGGTLYLDSHLGTDVRPDISEPTPFIYLSSENRNLFIYLLFKITTYTILVWCTE